MQEFQGASSSSSSYNIHSNSMATTPQPMEGLNDSGPPPFLTKTYDIVEDSSTNHIISWSIGNNSFIVWDLQAFSMTLLPRFFKHNNFSSFVRQLNTYNLCKFAFRGFRKIDPDRWEFANEKFLRGQRHLLKSIRRRKTVQQQPAQGTSQYALDPCVEIERFGVGEEIDRLKRGKQVLMVELVKLRQEQHSTRSCLQVMEERLKKTEMKQQQMMSFLAKAMQNPNFVQQLIQQKDRIKELEEAISKKRRRRIDNQRVKVEPDQAYDDDIDAAFGVSEFGELAMDLQGITGNYQKNIEFEHVEGIEEYGSYSDKRLDEGFWNDLLNDDIEEEISVLQVDEDEDVDDLVEELGILGSSPN